MASGKEKQGCSRWYVSLVFPLGLMLSPDSLSLLGNWAGVSGIHFLQMLCFGAIVHSLTAFSYNSVYHPESGARGEVDYVKQSLGSVTAFLFPICSRIAFAVCATTGILATAGYVFNEIFLIWFPNMGFSFLLLTVLLMIGWWGKKAVITAQVFSMVLVVSGLLFLSLWGLLPGEDTPANGAAVKGASYSLIHLYALGLVFFVGFDLSAVIGDSGRKRPGRAGSLMLWAIAIGGLVLAVWGWVSLLQVSPQRLTATSVPYSIAAREILGGPGREIMGVVILSTCFGFSNAILTAVSGILSGAVRKKGIARNGDIPGKGMRFPLVILFLAIVLMLASGLAGEPHLEVFTRGSIYLWLLNYAIIHLAVLTHIVRSRQKSAAGALIVPAAGLLLTFGAVVSLICFDANSVQVLQFMAVYLGIAFTLFLVWMATVKPFFTFSNGG